MQICYNKVAVDGIILDWLRFDDYKMDLSKSTRNAFKKKYGYDPITISFSTNNAKRRQWNSWRTSQLASYVKQASRSVRQTKKDILLGAFILPPEFTECGQDVGKFKSYIDVVLPMSYYKDWDFTPSWVYGKNSGILYDTQKKQKTPPLFQHLICLHPHKRIVIRQFSKRRKKIILRLNA